MVPFPVTLNDPSFKLALLFDVDISETVQNTNIVMMEY